jgi:hypothetical protein
MVKYQLVAVMALVFVARNRMPMNGYRYIICIYST